MLASCRLIALRLQPSCRPVLRLTGASLRTARLAQASVRLTSSVATEGRQEAESEGRQEAQSEGRQEAESEGRYDLEDESEGLVQRGHAATPLRALKGKSNRNPVKHFVDWTQTRLIAGDGGDGSISTSSVLYVEFAGPDGGDGGSGAHVIFEASSRVRDLGHIKGKVQAPRGGAGKNLSRQQRT